MPPPRSPKSPTPGKGGNSNHSTPQRGRSPNRNQGGGKGRAPSSSKPQTNFYPQPQNTFSNQPYVPYPPYQPQFFPMAPMTYAQVVQQPPPPPPPQQFPKGGKGKGMYAPLGKGNMGGRGGGIQTNPTPQQEHSPNYLGGQNTPWAGQCGYCYKSQRAFQHDHRTCPHNPANSGKGKGVGKGGIPTPPQGSVAPPTTV